MKIEANPSFVTIVIKILHKNGYITQKMFKKALNDLKNGILKVFFDKNVPKTGENVPKTADSDSSESSESASSASMELDDREYKDPGPDSNYFQSRRY